MEHISEKEINELNQVLQDTLELIIAQGSEVGLFKSHYALILSFTTLQWGEKNHCSNTGVITLNPLDFKNKTPSQRVSLIKGYLTEVIGSTWFKMKDRRP